MGCWAGWGVVPEPIDWPVGTPDHIRNPIPHREPCEDCGLMLSEAEREDHDCPATHGAVSDPDLAWS